MIRHRASRIAAENLVPQRKIIQARRYRSTSVAVGCRANALRTRSTKFVIEPLDVVFAEVRAAPNLHQNEIAVPDVLSTVRCLNRDVYHAAGINSIGDAVDRDDTCALHDEPMLGSTGMTLVAKSFTSENRDQLGLHSGRSDRTS
jgi:hypothetical protein